jgi:hypothetical protein
MPVVDPSAWTLPRLRIDREGTWFHEDDEITHVGILSSLWASLEVDTDGHFVSVGPVRVPVAVEDAPFVVLRVEEAQEGLTLLLVDGTRETLRPDTLRLGPEGAPYCRVKAGRFAARFSRPAAHQLLAHVEVDEGTGATILVAGRARHSFPASGGG